LILSGEYLGYLPTHYAASWVARGEMKALLEHELTYDAPFEIAYDPVKESLPALKIFIGQIVAMRMK
jgi:hypothetical protein